MSLGRTTVASAVLGLLAYASAHWLTHDFQVWTAEGARRIEIAWQPVPAVPIAVEGPDISDQTLAALLSSSGTPTIVDFMYTRCVSVCAALGSVFQQMQASIHQQRDAASGMPVRLMSITFDPGRDDPGTLAAYASKLSADPRVWRFVRTAEAADTRALLNRYQVTVIPDGLGGYEHNAALLVMNAQGKLVRVFDYTEADTALAYARSLTAAGAQ